MSSEKEPVAWLRRQVEARLALAREASPETDGHWWRRTAVTGHYDDGRKEPVGHLWAGEPLLDVDGDVFSGEDIVVYDEGRPSEVQFDHIAANDPRDTIARCEAELAILEAHNQAEHYCPIPVLPGRHGQLWTPEEGPCWTLHLLASAYRHHAGYADHWGGQG